MAPSKQRILQPYYVSREWSEVTAEDIQLNFERLFRAASGSGETVTETAAVETTDPGNHDTAPKLQTYYEGWPTQASVVPVAAGFGSTGTPANQGAASPPFADAPYYGVGTPFGNAFVNWVVNINSFGVPNTSIHDLGIYNFDAHWIMRTDTNTGFAGQYLFFVGLNAQTFARAGPYSPTQAGCYFRYNTASVISVPPDNVNHSFWMVQCHDGTTLSPATSTGIPVVADTRYHLRIRKVGSQCFFSINDSSEIVVGANVPVLSFPNAAVFAELCNYDGGDRHLWISRAWVTYGT